MRIMWILLIISVLFSKHNSYWFSIFDVDLCSRKPSKPDEEKLDSAGIINIAVT